MEPKNAAAIAAKRQVQNEKMKASGPARGSHWSLAHGRRERKGNDLE
jgi:hypothetical protein